MRRAQDRARSATIEYYGARSATIKSRALGALKLAREARDENVPAKRADFFFHILGYFFLFVTFFQTYYLIFHNQKVAKHCKEQNKKES